jgi:type IV secretory pathway VirB2 component (pilin)
MKMNKDLLGTAANTAAAIGVAICAVTGIARLLGSYHVLGYEAMTLFIGGISLMVFAALIKLHLIERHMSQDR